MLPLSITSVPRSFTYVNAVLCLREEVCRCLDTKGGSGSGEAGRRGNSTCCGASGGPDGFCFAAPQLPTAGRLDLRAPARLYEAASFQSEEIEKCGNYRTERET